MLRDLPYTPYLEQVHCIIFCYSLWFVTFAAISMCNVFVIITFFYCVYLLYLLWPVDSFGGKFHESRKYGSFTAMFPAPNTMIGNWQALSKICYMSK